MYGAGDSKLGSSSDVPGCREAFASVEKLKERGWAKDGLMWRHSKWHKRKDSLTYKEAQDTICGSIIRGRIMKGLKPLADAIERVTKAADEQGYIRGIDGRKLLCRSPHSALNLQCQSTGAIIIKTGVVRLMDRLLEEGMIDISPDYVPGTGVEMFTFYHNKIVALARNSYRITSLIAGKLN
ncbi:MAG: hypothetical protein HRT61_19955 [Ekhidna sp.]|nr:hypothetical protein [Ekhidna sp.]